MVFVIYAAPNYTVNAVTFISKLASIPGVRLGLVSMEPVGWLPQELSRRLEGFEQVQDIFDGGQLTAAARALSRRHGPVHRIIGATEQVQLAVAEVREQLGIAGMGVETMRNFRDKNRMKALLRAAGLPCARCQLAATLEDATAFAAQVGFPLIVKPPDGAGSISTFRVNDARELETAIQQIGPTPENPTLLEEFVTGTEHSFDTFSLNGKPLFHSLSHYYPNPLEVLREAWIQWQVLVPREVEHPQYDDIRQAAFRTLEVLGMQTAMSHLEWFRRPDGSLAISEVAARPPGAQFTTLISRAADFDAIEAWARLMIFGEFEVPQRKYAVGAVYLRGMGEGKVSAVHGLDKVYQDWGRLITDAKIPKIGQEKAPTYEGEGFIILRHPETRVVKEALGAIVSTVRVELRN